MKLRHAKKTLITIITLLILTSPSYAAEKPQSLGSDARIKVAAYNPDNVIPITLNIMTSTQFILNKDEHIIDVQTGDAIAWQFDNKHVPPYMFFLKPTIPESDTNVTVVTDKRSYYFHLHASSDIEQKNTTYVVRLIYPEEEKLKMLRAQAAMLNLAKDPSEYNWNYSYNGDRSILPLHVFDDGQFTYLELRQGQPVPAVFAVDNTAGHESVINFRRQGNYLVIERIAPQFTLRNGQYAVASLFNDDLIKRTHAGVNHVGFK